MNAKAKAILVMLLVFTLGCGAGWVFSSVIPFMEPQVCEEARRYAGKVTVGVFQAGVEEFIYSFDPSNIYIETIHYHEGGQVLTWREETKWQICLGMEDFPTEDWQGDYTDAVLKIVKFEDGRILFQVGCLGAFRKRVYYEGNVKLDTATGKTLVDWTI